MTPTTPGCGDPWLRTGKRALVLGHRGCRGPRVENTLAAFEFARASGAEGIELDVRLSKTGQVYVFHDATLERLVPHWGPTPFGELTEGDLQAIRLEDGSRVPSLAETLAALRDTNLVLNIELKGDSHLPWRLASRVAQVVRRSRWPQARLLYSSFYPQQVALMAAAFGRRGCAQLVHADQAHRSLAQAGNAWARWTHCEDRCLAGPLSYPKFGRVNVWTVNDPSRARQLSRWGVNGLISDRPDQLLRVLED